MPVALGDDAVEGDAIPCSAPGEEEDVGVGCGDGFGGGVGAGCAEILASGGFDQFGDPGLGVDEGFAPLFAVDDGGLGAACALRWRVASMVDCIWVMRDSASGCASTYGGDEADVFVDVGEGVRRESEDGEAGFEDCGEGLHAVGDAGDD